MRKYLLAFIVFCFGFWVISCSKSDSAKRQSVLSEKFVVDTAKLGIRSETDGLSFRIPLHWQSTDSSMMSVLRMIAANEIGKFKLTPQAVYQNSSTGSFLTVSGFADKPKANENFTSWARGFIDDYKLTHPKSKINEEWLAVGGQPAIQLIHEDSVSVHCEFVVQGTSPLKFSFTVPLLKWPEERAYVESSIGSLKKI